MKKGWFLEVESQLGKSFKVSGFNIYTASNALSESLITTSNHKNHNFLASDWFKNVLFSTNSLAKLLSDSLLLDSLLLDSLLSDSLISQSYSKM